MDKDNAYDSPCSDLRSEQEVLEEQKEYASKINSKKKGLIFLAVSNTLINLILLTVLRGNPELKPIVFLINFVLQIILLVQVYKMAKEFYSLGGRLVLAFFALIPVPIVQWLPVIYLWVETNKHIKKNKF